MTTVLWPMLFALLLWWFSTGLIIYLDGLPTRTFRWSMLGGTLLLIAALFGLAHAAGDASVTGAYLAFACSLVIWGWLEMSFYMGYVTGPRRHRCKPGCKGIRHFGHALQVSLYHELAIVLLGAVVLVLSWNAPNKVGLWTFLVLAWMHESARLNVFLGVRNLNAEFIPPHMDHLRSFLRKRPMNALFPISVTVSTVVLVLLVQQAMSVAGDPFAMAGFTFVATIMALAILEHWFLVLPLPFARLWDWSLKSRSVPGHRQKMAAQPETRAPLMVGIQTVRQALSSRVL